MSTARMAGSLRGLVQAAAVRDLRPWDGAAAMEVALQWARFRVAYPDLRSGRVEAIVNEHAATWARLGKTGAIRRAKRDRADRAARAAVAAMLAVVAL